MSGGGPYRVTSLVLLLCADDCAASLGLIESAFTPDYCLTLRSSTAGFAADLGDGVPIVISHDSLLNA